MLNFNMDSENSVDYFDKEDVNMFADEDFGLGMDEVSNSLYFLH